MLKRWSVSGLVGLAGLLFGAPSLAQRNIPQATYQIDCYGSLQSYKITHPSLSCTCSSARSAPSCTDGKTQRSSQSQRSSQGKYPSVKAQAAATITGAVMGAVLANIFSDPGPSPQQIEAERQRAEAQRLAELARQKEEEARHQKLLGSLTSLPGRSSAPRGRVVSGVRLTALMEPSTQTQTMEPEPAPLAMRDFQSDDEARAWLANPETLFASLWKPVAVGDPLPSAAPLTPACPGAGQGCEIGVDPAKTPMVTRIATNPQSAGSSRPLPDPEEMGRRVVLLRPTSCVGVCDDTLYFLQAMAAMQYSATQGANGKSSVTIDKLKETGKILLEEFVLPLVEASGPKGKAAVLVYNVRSMANSVLADSIKVAGHLGSSDLTAPPVQITSLEEHAAPFSGDPEGLNKLLVGSTVLSKKLLDLWRRQQ